MLNRRELLKLFGAAAAVPAVLSQAISAGPVKVPLDLAVIPEPETDDPLDMDFDDGIEEPVDAGDDTEFRHHDLTITKRGIPCGGRIDLKCSTITFKDSGSEKEVTLRVGEGNITWNEPCDYVYELDRGCLDIVRERDQQPLQVSIDMAYEFVKSDDEDWMSIIKSNQTNISLQCEDGNEIYNYDFDGFMWHTMDWDLACATFSISGQCVPELSL